MAAFRKVPIATGSWKNLPAQISDITSSSCWELRDLGARNGNLQGYKRELSPVFGLDFSTTPDGSRFYNRWKNIQHLFIIHAFIYFSLIHSTHMDLNVYSY